MLRWTAATLIVVLYVSYWTLLLFGFFDPQSGQAEMPGELPFWGVVLGLPSFLLGLVIGRAWSVAVPVAVFIAALPVPERCVRTVDGDSVVLRCWGADFGDLGELLMLTLPFVLAGLITITIASRVRRMSRRATAVQTTAL